MSRWPWMRGLATGSQQWPLVNVGGEGSSAQPEGLLAGQPGDWGTGGVTEFRPSGALAVSTFAVGSGAPLGEGTPSLCTGVAVGEAVWAGILHSGSSQA